ncbi:hypothetical protein [Flavivirga eckloniae]|nr:hypothetical protein [Flavivirga eckloniae]
MKYNHIYFLGLILLIISCNNKKDNSTPASNNKVSENIQKENESPNESNQTEKLKAQETSKENSIPEAILVIKKQFGDINSSIANYSKKENKDINISKDINPNNYAFEGASIHQLAIANLDRYYEGTDLKKAVVTFEGANEDLISEYYFWNNALFFVFKTKVNYLKPKWADDFKASDTKKTENRFYFKNDTLIRWLDPQKKQVDVTNEEAKKITQEILSDSQLYKNLK